MSKNAIYLNNVYNAANPVHNTQCITFDPAVGFEFINNGEVISVIAKEQKESKKDVAITVKPAEFKTLKNEVITIKNELEELKAQVNSLICDKVLTNSNETNE